MNSFAQCTSEPSMLAVLYVCMLICQYTHPLLANMLAVIGSCRFICWLVYCFSVTAVASLLTCAILITSHRWTWKCGESNNSKVQQEMCGIWNNEFTNRHLEWLWTSGVVTDMIDFEAWCNVLRFKCIHYDPICNLVLFEAGHPL